jgi:hypothetical protein
MPSQQQQQQQQYNSQKKQQYPPQPNPTQKGFYNPSYRYSTLGGDEQTSTVFDDYQQSQPRFTVINEQQQYYQQHQQQYLQYQQQNSNKITNFIFPAIRVKAYYESTHCEVNKRLFKKGNLYSTIKLESFVLPQTYMLQSDYFKTKDMCIGPQLLDFLEHTLEPFGLGNKTTNIKTDLRQDGRLETDENENESDEDGYIDYDDLVEGEEDDIFESSEHHHHHHHHNQRFNGQQKKDTSIAVGSSSVSKTNQTQVYFPVDVIVIISMLPSSIRFTCAPQSTMECLLKLPTIELVFSTKSLSSGQIMQTESNESKGCDFK